MIETNNNQLLTKIGLEIHTTLLSVKKIFNFNNNLSANKRPVNYVEAWELGYLGTLPVLNDQVIRLALKTCLLLNAKISKHLSFDRKMYDYFDLSKGFQITQQKNPIGENGYFTFLFNDKITTIPISRIQLEEDTAKTFHQKTSVTLLDFSRSGNPLLEIVTEPVFSDINQVVVFIKQLQSALAYIGVSEAKMEQGELRIDLNFSFSSCQNYQTPRYEVKNLNSIKNLKMSFQQELQKHVLLYKERNGRKCSLKNDQTLGFNEQLGKTFVQRKKTNYFYLPEVNIPIILIDDNQIISLKEEMPISLLSMWLELNENGNSVYSNMIFEKQLLAKAINYLRKKKIKYLNNFDSFFSFFFNHILVSIQEYDNQQIDQFFSKKITHLWRIFLFFKKRSIAKEKINSLIHKLFTIECKNYSVSQLKELFKKEEINKENSIVVDIEKEIVTILREKKISRKLANQPLRVTNFLLGSLKNKFPSLRIDYKKCSEIVKKVLLKG